MIRFEDEMLPEWTSMLDLAARLSSTGQRNEEWFGRFARCSGVDDARTVLAEVETLRLALRARRGKVLHDLERTPDDARASLILAAWDYALDTMAQQASVRDTCSWRIEERPDDPGPEDAGGDISLRRV